MLEVVKCKEKTARSGKCFRRLARTNWHREQTTLDWETPPLMKCLKSL